MERSIWSSSSYYNYSFDFVSEYTNWYIYGSFSPYNLSLGSNSSANHEAEIEEQLGPWMNIHPRKIFVDSDGIVWISASEGLFRYDDEL